MRGLFSESLWVGGCVGFVGFVTLGRGRPVCESCELAGGGLPVAELAATMDDGKSPRATPAGIASRSTEADEILFWKGVAWRWEMCCDGSRRTSDNRGIEMHLQLLIGLSLAGAPSVDPAAAAPAPTDNLIVYRANAEPIVWSPTIKVDGVKIAALPNRRYTSAHVAPGVHTVTTSWPFISRQRSSSATMTIKGDEPHYMEITGISRYGGSLVTLGSKIAEVEPAGARAAIASCCAYKAPK
jgi:hypothetical protein